MKNSKKRFILIETALGLLVVLLISVMLLEKNGKDQKKVSVVIQNSDDNQWSAFKYGLKMAAEDQKIEMFVVSTGGVLTAQGQKDAIEWEINHGADAVIVMPVPGEETEKMLNKIQKKVPVMLVERTTSLEPKASVLPITQPDNYAMGAALAEELLKDYSGNIKGKTIGIFSGAEDSQEAADRRKGFEDGIQDTGAHIQWTVSEASDETREKLLEAQPKVDLVIALDDSSLTEAGDRSSTRNLHGALVYGIGNSTEAIFYLDTGAVECLVVPDEFNVGYQSLTEVAESLGNHFRKMKDRTVTHTVIRRDELFSEENQKIIFTMSQ